MAYHRGGHAGAVAVSYSTNTMQTPLSPNRRYSSGNTGTTTSGVGSSTSTKLSSYRSSSSFDRPSYYNPGSTSSSGYSSTSTHRSSYSSEYRSRYCSPARSLSVSSSSYSDTGTSGTGTGVGSGGGSGSSNNCSSGSGGVGISSSPSINNTNRYSTSLSRDRSENRETTSYSSLATSAADLYAKYSPANYVPNITASNERNFNNKSSSLNSITNSSSSSSSSLASPSSSSSITTNGYGNNSANNSSIFGGNNLSNNKISTLRDNSNELLSPAIIQGRPPRAARRSPVNTVINNHALQQTETTSVNEEVNDINYSDADLNDLKFEDKSNNNINNNNDNNNSNDKKNENNEDGAAESNNENFIINSDVNYEDKISIINSSTSSRVNNKKKDNNFHYNFSSSKSSNAAETIRNNCRSEINGSFKNAKFQKNDTSDPIILLSNTNSSALKINTINDALPLTCIGIFNKKECTNNVVSSTNNDITRKKSNNNLNYLEEEEGKKNSEDYKIGGGADFDNCEESGDPNNSGILKQQQNHDDDDKIINRVVDIDKFNNDDIAVSQFVNRKKEGEKKDNFIRDNKNSTIYNIDNTTGGGRTSPGINDDDNILFKKNIIVSRPNGNHAGDNNTTSQSSSSPSSSSSSSIPSTSRRGDNYSSNGTNTNGSNGIGNNTASQLPGSTAQQNIYRGINDQIEGSPTIRAPRNRLQTPRDERCGLNGLRNIGNTCFMNSVIQCLSNTRPLLEYLINEQYLADINTATSGMKGALIKAFSQVIQELWEVGGDQVVNTTSLKSQIQRFAPRFMGYSQQDAQEFLRYLLEGLHEDVNRVTVKPQPIHTDIPEHYSDSQKAAESWKRYLRNEDSTIVDAFVGQLRSSLHCTSCGHVSVTLDPFWDLSLPIPTRSGTVKLNQCLEHFTKEEVLDGDEKPTCSKCQMRRKCTKSFRIQKFPKILVIHLKRFSPMERFRGKLNTLVDFPLTGLDLGEYSAPRVAGCTYNLYGVANHSGTTYSGHYTAYCKHPYSGEWHEYNDSRVSSISARSVISSEGYVLFYEQQPHSSNL